VSVSFSGRYVATCTACPYWPRGGRYRPCPVCKDTGKVIKERHPTAFTSVTIGPAPADAPLGPMPEHTRHVHRAEERKEQQ
jgi:hypothetical protein